MKAKIFYSKEDAYREARRALFDSPVFDRSIGEISSREDYEVSENFSRLVGGWCGTVPAVVIWGPKRIMAKYGWWADETVEHALIWKNVDGSRAALTGDCPFNNGLPFEADTEDSIGACVEAIERASEHYAITPDNWPKGNWKFLCEGLDLDPEETDELHLYLGKYCTGKEYRLVIRYANA